MKDSTLLKLSLAFSLIGLTVLVGLTELIKPSVISIEEVSSKLDSFVYIEGNVVSTTYKQDLAFLTVEDSTGEILVVIFDKLEKNILKGDRIGVSGQISLYRGEMEIIAEKVFCIQCGN